MKTETIEANFGTGSDKVFAGEVELEIPETIADCLELFKDEKKVVALVVRSYVIDERAKLKARPKKPMTTMEKLFAAMSPEDQAALMAKHSNGNSNGAAAE